MRRVPDRIFIAPGNPVTSNWAGQWFKTFDLHAMGHCYELCSHGLLWRIDQAASNPRRQVAIHMDIVLNSGTETLVARFSTAAVDWIRSIDEMSESGREFLSSEKSVTSASHDFSLILNRRIEPVFIT
ncbi:MAG: hypothetical protein IT422_16720 [Pirellulaceae bacterium]|nr:hypothetical protein [Pirellulaceae bacterium]